MSKIYVILVEYCMKLTLLSASKRSNYYMWKKRIILESSWKLANRLLIDGDLLFTVLVPQGENPVLHLLW